MMRRLRRLRPREILRDVAFWMMMLFILSMLAAMTSCGIAATVTNLRSAGILPAR